jgi:hypothetical protein
MANIDRAAGRGRIRWLGANHEEGDGVRGAPRRGEPEGDGPVTVAAPEHASDEILWRKKKGSPSVAWLVAGNGESRGPRGALVHLEGLGGVGEVGQGL